MLNVFILTFSLLIPNSYSQKVPDKDPVLSAMSAELKRSYENLKNSEKIPIYFLGYEIWDKERVWVSVDLGAVADRGERRDKTLTVDVRVGSLALDNTHEIKGRESYSSGSNSKNIGSAKITESDEDAIRARIWKLTDEEYKRALDNYMKVEINKRVTAMEEDKSGDFSPAKTGGVFYERAELGEIDLAPVENMLKRITGKFKNHGFLLNSGMGFYAGSVNRYIVNSEGARVVTGNRHMRIYCSLNARTEDGMDLNRYKDYHFADISDMPEEKELERDVQKLIDELESLKEAGAQEPFTGPAILDNTAAAVFFHEIFGHRVEGHRQKSASEGQTFAKKIGEKIMPEFLTVYDDPSLESYSGSFLRGHYEYDDEAVKSRKVVLVENGALKNFLMSRIPIENFPVSNGHGRRSEGRMAVARQGNLIVESSSSVPYERLKELLAEEIRESGKPYGLIIKDISGGFTITKRSLPQSFTILVKYAVKVFPDGREEEVARGLNMIGTPLQTFQKIIRAGNDPEVYNGDCGAESGWVPVSAVSPSLLFSEIETEKVQKSNRRPPVLKPPYMEGEK